MSIARLCTWLVLSLLCSTACSAGTTDDWSCSIAAAEPSGGITFGAKPGYGDGYDAGEPPIQLSGWPGVWMAFYRSNGPDWTGPTGLYSVDMESPIAAGGSHTWSDIYLFAYQYTPQGGDRVVTIMDRVRSSPIGWYGHLVLDYTPASMNWTGPTEWWFPLWRAGYSVPALPCPVTDDPFNPNNVTRMHLTVYTYPVPEPSSLAALGLALAGVGTVRLRRKR